MPSFVYMQDAQVDFEGGKVLTDIVYGGNFFAILPVERLGMELVPSNVGKLVERGIAFRDAAREQLEISHPTEADINPLHGVEMYVDNPSPGVHARNIMTFAQHSFDRSPCGTGDVGKVGAASRPRPPGSGRGVHTRKHSGHGVPKPDSRRE